MNATRLARVFLVLAGLSFALGASAQQTIGTAFTFQGELRESGAPANGSYDFRARLTPTTAGVSPAEVVVEDVAVVDGRFVLPLDFTDLPFRDYGDQLGMELATRAGASTGAWTVINPFVRLTPVPYALAARSVAPGSVGSAEINPQQVQRRVTGVCPQNSAINAVAADGSVTCDADDAGVTLQAGFGLLGGGSDGIVPLAIDPVNVQRRVSGSCAAGSSIRTINQDGSVECETDDGVGSIAIIPAVGERPGIQGFTQNGFATATCPGGSRVVGGGFQSNCPGVQIYTNQPNIAGTAWGVEVLKPATFGCPNNVLRVTAYAVCAPL